MAASEALSHELPLVTAVLEDPNANAEMIGRLPVMIAASDSAVAAARESLVTLGDASLYLAPTPEGLATLRRALSFASIDTILKADATQWETQGIVRDRLTQIRTELVGVIDKDAAALASAANRQALLTAAGAALAVLVSVAIALMVARSIVRPMRSLTRAAVTVREQLPRLIDQVAVPGHAPDLSLAEIPVTSNDEVGRLAAAFNEVNATTLQVAQEQAALRGSIAEMFVNVARRDQVLLNRQLSFIDALERSEEDPKVLADLFRLDHLATRMRRNAESLLVLAGIDTGRRLRDTLPLSDVIRTASSEIEHYERVLLDLPADPMMLGHTALPAAHLLAELLENATMFAEPGSPVHVSTGRDETHVLVTVLDQGMGMSPEELEAAQSKITSASAGEVLGAQRLGMFVIGRIASRLGAKVELAVGPHGSGTQATVRLPLALFVDIADVPLVAPVVPASTMGRHFPVADPTEVPEIASRPVDLAELTDGATGLGLPRRRVRGADVAAEAPSVVTGAQPVVDADEPSAPVEAPEPVAVAESTIPAAPGADALAGAAATVAEDWAPLVAMSAPLTPRRRGQHAAPSAEDDEPRPDSASQAVVPTPHPWEDGSTRRARNRRAASLDELPGDASQPAEGGAAAEPNDASPAFAPFGFDAPEGETPGGEPAPVGLPSRTPAASAPSWPPTAGAAPVAPDARVTMFNGFRSRRAETIAEQLEVRAPEQLAAPALEQIVAEPEVELAPETDAPQPPAFVVPLLVEDEEWEDEQELLPLGVPVAYDDDEWSATGHVAEPWEIGYQAVAPVEAIEDDDEDWAPLPEPVTPHSPELVTPVAQPAPLLAPAPAPRPPAPPAPEPSAAPAPLPAAWADGISADLFAEPAPAADFASLLSGEVPSVAEPTKAKRRGLFGRRGPKAAAAASTPVAAPVVPLPVPPPVFRPDVTVAPPAPPAAPARQSVWSANGSHVQQGWAPTDGGSGAEGGLPAAQELASLSVQRKVDPAPAPEAAPGFGVAPAAAVAPGAAAPAAPAPAAPSGNTWMPDPKGVELMSYPAWPSPQRTPATPPVGEAEVGAEEPEVPQPREPMTRAAAPAPTAPAATASAPAAMPRRGVPAQQRSATFVPSDSREMDSIGLRAGIAEQALAELSMLSSYRPQTVGSGSTPPLVRRTPAVIPTDEPVTPRQPAAPRDANEVRSLLASFQSGTSRGRTAVDETAPEISADAAAKQGTSW